MEQYQGDKLPRTFFRDDCDDLKHIPKHKYIQMLTEMTPKEFFNECCCHFYGEKPQPIEKDVIEQIPVIHKRKRGYGQDFVF